jgi:hypothetical protein
MRKTTQLEEEVMNFLNLLRESGVTNMFGAGPYVEEEFGIDQREARRILSLWMHNFNAESKYERIKEKP